MKEGIRLLALGALFHGRRERLSGPQRGIMKDTNQPIFKAKITGWGDTDDMGYPRSARVVPLTSPDAPTLIFDINYTCRPPRCDLSIGTVVWCAMAADSSGIVLARHDGNDTREVPGGIDVVDGGVHVEGPVYADDDVTGEGTSLHSHTHQGVHGTTSPPN